MNAKKNKGFEERKRYASAPKPWSTASVSAVAFDTLQAAKEWKENQKRAGRRGDTIQMPSKNTLVSVIDHYVAKNGDWSSDKTDHLNALKRDLGHLSLSKLTEATLYDYIADMDVSKGRRNARLSYLKTALKHARYTMHLAPRMDQFAAAREGLSMQKVIGKSKERTRKTDAAEIRLISEHHNAEDNRAVDLPAILEILSILPIRVGELCVGDDLRHGILWTDIDHANRQVTLRNRKHPDRDESKDEVIPLFKVVRDGKEIDPYDLLVTNRRHLGNHEGPFPFRVKAISKSMKKACRAAGITKDTLHVHDLRAHSITAMLEADIDPLDVMVVSGHKDTKVFFKHYVRPNIAKLAAKLERKMAA